MFVGGGERGEKEKGGGERENSEENGRGVELLCEGNDDNDNDDGQVNQDSCMSLFCLVCKGLRAHTRKLGEMGRGMSEAEICGKKYVC